uniref:Thrombomodulin n=1 Tax=Myripristis murdjan TaxID=586833 RepID=A0A667Y5H9_9TELE
MRRALLLCAAVLWRLGEAAVSRRELCAGSKCYAVFQESRDFPGAQKSCEDFGGHLLTLQSLRTQEILSTLLDGLGGRYWIGLQLQDGRCPDRASQLFGYTWVVGDGATDSTSWSRFNTDCSLECVSVSEEGNSTWWQQSCRDKLQGYLCQYSFQEPCARFPVNEDVNVDYTTATGFSANDWEVFPQGSIVVLQQTDAKHLTSKYICFSSNWAQAPWNCGVMKGGCEHKCVSQNRQHSCTCPTGQPLHANKITCEEDPCAGCAHKCENEGDTYACRCDPGYTLAADRKGSCSDENRECLNKGFTECVDMDECVSAPCEHHCTNSPGSYNCSCFDGYIVIPETPHKCKLHCGKAECPAECDPNNPYQCDCPDGYILEERQDEMVCLDFNECEMFYCEQGCENTYGGYVCSCNAGYKLVDQFKCRKTDGDTDKDTDGWEGSGAATTPYFFTTPSVKYPEPTRRPSKVTAGGLLGIIVCIVVVILVLVFVVHHILRRRGKMESAGALKARRDEAHDLQQVTTNKNEKAASERPLKQDA